jgi:hypothetical protein
MKEAQETQRQAGQYITSQEEENMKIGISLVVFCIVALTGGIAVAEQKGPAEAAAEKIVQTVADGCKAELETYCKNVTAGEGLPLRL